MQLGSTFRFRGLAARVRQQSRHRLCSMKSGLIQDSHPLAIKIHGCILCIRSLCRTFLRVWRGPVKSIDFCIAWYIQVIQSLTGSLTNNFWSTVLTTISSGVYWLTSKRNFNTLLSPSSWIKGEFISVTNDCCGFCNALLLLLVVLRWLKNILKLVFLLINEQNQNNKFVTCKTNWNYYDAKF